MSSVAATPSTVKEVTKEVLQTNKDHQYALKVYTERLEAELEAVDKLLVSTHLRLDSRVFTTSWTRRLQRPRTTNLMLMSEGISHLKM
jgi:hypothetical protein